MKLIMLIETYNNQGIRYSGFNNHMPRTWTRINIKQGLLWWTAWDEDVLYYQLPDHDKGKGKGNKKLSGLPRLKKIFVS